VTAEDRAGVGEALHVELERVDALGKQSSPSGSIALAKPIAHNGSLPPSATNANACAGEDSISMDVVCVRIPGWTSTERPL
jgi:hypothetical protein